MFLFIFIFTSCFCIFTECYFGSIALRPNSDNKIILNIPSLLYFLFHPLHNSFLWNPKIIIGNFPFMLGIGLLINLIYL